ncbi:MAG: ATP-binding cassette domain-containing protein [Candidatus Zixiibacteriota bacterium]
MSDDLNNSDSALLKLINLSRAVSEKSCSRMIIDSVSCEFNKNEIYSIVGPSGAGKTTLLRLLNRLDEKTSGDILFHNSPMESYPVLELRRRIAKTFQIPYLFPGTVLDNLAYGLPEGNDSHSTTLAGFLDMVGLDPQLINADPEKLSVGQKQRVALARSLVMEPEILLLDEPTSALDPGAARTIEKLLLRLNQELALTLIIVTHNFGQALRMGGNSLIIADGRLIESGRTDEIFKNPMNEISRKFINGDLR